MKQASTVRLHAWVALLAVVVASTAPANAQESENTQESTNAQGSANAPADWFDLTARDQAILECMTNGESSENCELPGYDEFDHDSIVAYDWMLPAPNWGETAFFSLPALTGPSAAELYRYHWNQHYRRDGALPPAPFEMK